MDHGGNNTVSHTQDTIHSTRQSYSGKSSLQKISKILSANLTFTKDIVFTVTHILLICLYDREVPECIPDHFKCFISEVIA